MKKLILVAVLIAVPTLALARDPEPLVQAKSNGSGLRWLRRATLVSSCVAGTVINNWALHELASQPNVTLSGPFLSNGKPHYGALIGIGAGSCAFSAVAQETNIFGRHTRRSDLIDTFWNLGATGLGVWETYRFRSLTDQARAAQRLQPGTLSTTSAH